MSSLFKDLSSNTRGYQWTKLIPGTMFSINSRQEGPAQGNELEDTCSSSRSSFTELWDSSIPIEIRDGSIQRGTVFNPTSAVLHTCNRQVMAPYFCMLSVIGWRPLFRNSRWFYRGLNAFYTLIILMLLLFSYVSSIVACQTRLNILLKPVPTSATSPTTHLPPHNKTTVHPTTTPANTSSNGTTAIPWWTINQGTTMPMVFSFKMFTMSPAKPDWKPTECTHIFSGYIVPDLLHFIAFILGFYHFRIQESEGLQALIEMVFLQSRNQAKVVKRLRSFLIVGAVCLLISTGAYILFIYSYGLSSVTGFRNNIKGQWLACCFMVLGNLVEDCVTFVIVLNYCAQCQLLIFYLKDIALRMEEKTAAIDHVMKNIWEVKKYISIMNGVAARITTMIVFNYCELTVLGLCILAMEPRTVPMSQLGYRIVTPMICCFTLICPVIMGALLTSCGQTLKQLSLHMRVFGYPSTTQFDRDSFLLFVQHADLKPKLFHLPLKASYLCGLLTVTVFIVLLLMQTSILGGNNKYI